MIGNMTAPVNEGDKLDVTIEAIGDKGDGIAKKDGFVLVIPGTKIDQKVRIKVTKVLRKVGFAEVVGDAESTEEESAEEVPGEESAEEVPGEESAEEVPGEESAEEDSEDSKEPEAEPEDSETFGEDLE